MPDVFDTLDEQQSEGDIFDSFPNQVAPPDLKINPYEAARSQLGGQRMTPFGPENPQEVADLYGPIVRAEMAAPGMVKRAIGDVFQAAEDIGTSALQTTGLDPAAQPGQGVFDISGHDLLTIPGSELIRPGGIQPLRAVLPPETYSGVEKELGDQATGFTSPGMLAMAPLGFPGLVGAPAAKATQALFEGGIVSNIPESISRLSEAQTPQEKAAAATGAGLNLLLGAGVGSRLLRERTPNAPQERNVPESGQREYPGADAQRQATEASGGNRPEPEAPQAKEGVQNAPKEQGGVLLEKPTEAPKAADREAAITKLMKDQGIEDREMAAAVYDAEQPKPVTEAAQEAKTLTPAYQVEGKIFTGNDHANARIAAAKEGVLAPDEAGGFVTDTGKFLTREEAVPAFERLSGKKPRIPQSLRSEDLAAEGLLGHLEKAEKVSPEVQDYAKTVLTEEKGGGTNRANEIGLKAQSVADLDALANVRRDLVKNMRTHPDPNVKMASGFKAQYPREAIETATNVGSNSAEAIKKVGGKDLGERPLDWRTHPEVAEWLRKNAKELGIALPPELEAPKASPGETVTQELYREAEEQKKKAQSDYPPIYDKIVKDSGLSEKELEALGILHPRYVTHPSEYSDIVKKITGNAPGGRLNKLYDLLTNENQTGRFLWGGTADNPKLGFEPDVPGQQPDPVAAGKALDAVNKIRKIFGAEPLPDFFKQGAPAAAPVHAAAKAESEVKRVAAVEGETNAKSIKSALVSELKKAIAEAPSEDSVTRKTATRVSGEVYETQPDSRTKITIDIPGDGQFTIWNTKENLSNLLAKAKKIATTSGEPAKITRRGMSAADKAWLEEQIKKAQQPQPAPAVTVTPSPEGKPQVHIAGKPLPPGATLAASFFAAPAAHPLGPLATISPRAAETLQHFTESVKKLPESIRLAWRSFAMQSLPRITASNRLAGEAGARYDSAPRAGRGKGLEFAGKVMEGIKEPLFDQKFGTALTEDNLRSKKQELHQQAIELHRQAFEANRAGDTESATALRDQGQQAFAESNRVTSLIGAEHSPFPTEEAYQQFFTWPQTQEAIARHKQLWEEQKDPLFRKANDLAPDVELATRGLQTGARVNLKAILPGETSRTAVGRTGRSPLIRQGATLLRRDPFARQMKGTGQVYEGSYSEIMANGFQKEYPVAAQHDFIKALLDAWDAVLTQKEFPKDLTIRGEETKAYLMKLKAWQGQWLQIKKSLAPEYESVSGLTPAVKIPYYTKSAEFLTNQSVKGLAEGSAHVANLTTSIFTGLGPTANPMLNALIKSAGRADVLWSLPKVLIKGFTNQKPEMLKLAEIGAAKEPYGGSLGWFINKIDQGVRLTAADTYKGMAEKGWVPDTETGLREFVNQSGQYSNRLQPRTIQVLRDTGVQPFATAMQTFNVQAVRNLGMGPGAKGTSAAASLALRADKAAGLIGFAVLVTAINKVVSGSATGPKGTPLGSVGWVGDDKKVHTFNLSRLFGYARSGQVTGIQPAIEARRLGLTPNQALAAGGRGVAGSALNYVTGPLNRTMAIAATGKRPGVPMVQEAKVVPPRDDMAPLKSQAAANVIQALQEANPAVDAVARYMEGKPLSEIAQRQFSRYTPRTGMSQSTIEALPKIVKTGEIQNYVDQLSKDARKLPLMERGTFIYGQLDKDGVQTQDRADVLKRLRIKGVWKYE